MTKRCFRNTFSEEFRSIAVFLPELKSVAIILLSLLWQYSLAYACLKLVNYSFFFWLPFYLSNNFGWKEAEADRLSVWYDVGGIIGEWQCGYERIILSTELFFFLSFSWYSTFVMFTSYVFLHLLCLRRNSAGSDL